MIEPMAFSTMLDRPPFLLPGVVLALRSAPPRPRYSSYHCISRTMAAATSGVAARAVSWATPSRTSVVSENMMLAPARTSRSAAKPTAGLAVTPENASLPPHCTPTTRSDAGQVSRRRAFRRSRWYSAVCMIESIIDMKPTCFSSCRHTTSSAAPSSRPTSAMLRSSTTAKLPGGSRRCGCSFSQPRLTTISSPPKLGFRLMLRTVRIGMAAPGASMATPQP